MSPRPRPLSGNSGEGGGNGVSLRAAVGVLLGLVARVWLLTLRMTIVQHPAASASDGRPWVLSFFHGQQFVLLGWGRRRPTVTLVSLSRDGDIQARALPRLGLRVQRGSTSRGGARALAAVVRALRVGGLDAAFAVDGPRGPLGVVHPGALAAARNAGGVVVPIACASARRWVLRRTWDQFELPWPFTRVAVVIGEPIAPDAAPLDELLALTRARIEACRGLAQESLA